jgi:cell wall-associated NlpC family hydrolase
MALTIALGLIGGAGPATAGPATADTTTANTTTANNATPGSTPAASVDSLQVQAQELAGQIAADGRSLDQLSASYEAAQIQFAPLAARQAALRQSMAAAAAAVDAAHRALKEQAVLAYLAGGAPIIGQIPSRSGEDRSLSLAYAEIVSGGQTTALQTYRATLDDQSRQKASLDANTRQVQATLTSIKADQAQAAATMASQEHALAQVKGQLSVEVAKVQAEQQVAEQAQEKALLSARGELPPSDSPPPATSGASPAPMATTHSPRSQAPAATAPSTTAPSTTGPVAGGASPTTSNPAASGGGATGGSTASRNTTQAPGADRVLAYARAQLGKPYQWGGAGPDSFDCSGLVMMAWEQAGIYFPHLAQDQYDLTTRIPLSALIPGDLVFFGTPDDVYHVGIYVGNGNMIDAPETGQNVQVQSIYWDNLLGAGRVTTSS